MTNSAREDGSEEARFNRDTAECYAPKPMSFEAELKNGLEWDEVLAITTKYDLERIRETYRTMKALCGSRMSDDEIKATIRYVAIKATAEG